MLTTAGHSTYDWSALSAIATGLGAIATGLAAVVALWIGREEIKYRQRERAEKERFALIYAKSVGTMLGTLQQYVINLQSNIAAWNGSSDGNAATINHSLESLSSALNSIQMERIALANDYTASQLASVSDHVSALKLIFGPFEFKANPQNLPMLKEMLKGNASSILAHLNDAHQSLRETLNKKLG